jgi:BCCT family betaine/carnitine transporter
MTQEANEIVHRPGDKNVLVLGMDIRAPVFFSSALIIALFVLGGLFAPEATALLLGGAKAWTLTHMHWFFSSATLVMVFFCFTIAALPIGKVRLGGKDAKPEFGTPSWLAMLFAAGVGIGMMFWGAAEPLAYFTGWSGTPLNAVAGSPEGMRLAMSATIFHWGFHPWAVYAVIGLALAFFAFNKGLPLSIRSCFYPLLGERVWGWMGDLIDILAVVATIFGLATSLGLGALQAAAGLQYLFGIESGLTTQIGIIIGVTAVAILSVTRGMDRGIKRLSHLNILFAIILLLFVLLAGPSWLILKGLPTNALHYVVDMIPLSAWINRNDSDWYESWTIFYWAWWISWSPFVGMFIARISKGRTVREFLAAVLFMPTCVSIIWFTVFGTTAIFQFQTGIGELSQGFTEVPLVLFQMLDNLPLAKIVSAFAVVLVLLFFITSSDSGSLVVDTITAGGKLDPPVRQRVFWASLQGVVAAILLIGGGNEVLGALQAGTITTALPFTLVLLVCCLSLYRGLHKELLKNG